jgi:hypothetical protein
VLNPDAVGAVDDFFEPGGDHLGQLYSPPKSASPFIRQ